MRLRRVTIENFRNFKHIDVRPGRTTVILGENNAGKSNFLHALRLLFDVQAERLRLELTLDDVNREAIRDGARVFTIRVEVGNLQDHDDLVSVFVDRLARDGDEVYVTIEGRYVLNDDGETRWEACVLPEPGSHHDRVAFTTKMARVLPLYFLEASRDADRETRATGRGMLAQLLSEVNFTDVEPQVRDLLEQANQRLNRSSDIQALSQGLSQRLVPHTPRGQPSVFISVGEVDGMSIGRNLRLGLARFPGDASTDLSRHGTGLQNLALIALFRHRVETQPHRTPILAIEESEAHLHPHAQRQLYRELEQTEAPVFLTTHSPALVKHADPRNLVLLRAVGRHETKAFQLPTDVGEDVLKSMQLLVRGGRSELFFARAGVIVEGETEMAALPAFAELLGCDLDREGISIVEANGNNFGFLLKVCAHDALCIPMVVTYDTDVVDKLNLHKSAADGGLISKAEFNQLKVAGMTPERRQQTLDELGWIGAPWNFERVVLTSGYLEVAFDAIQAVDEYGALMRLYERIQKEHGLSHGPEALERLIVERDWLKVVVARAVAEEVPLVGQVPPCYRDAIRKAMLLACGGVDPDENLVLHACGTGFMAEVLEEIEKLGYGTALSAFRASHATPRSNTAIVEFTAQHPAAERILAAVQARLHQEITALRLPDLAERLRPPAPVATD